jgi:hypothetical protein
MVLLESNPENCCSNERSWLEMEMLVLFSEVEGSVDAISSKSRIDIGLCLEAFFSEVIDLALATGFSGEKHVLLGSEWASYQLCVLRDRAENLDRDDEIGSLALELRICKSFSSSDLLFVDNVGGLSAQECSLLREPLRPL